MKEKILLKSKKSLIEENTELKKKSEKLKLSVDEKNLFKINKCKKNLITENGE